MSPKWVIWISDQLGDTTTALMVLASHINQLTSAIQPGDPDDPLREHLQTDFCKASAKIFGYCNELIRLLAFNRQVAIYAINGSVGRDGYL